MSPPSDTEPRPAPRVKNHAGKKRPAAPRRIGCITTGRADMGIYRPLLVALAQSDDFNAVCLAGGTHFAEEFGRTIEQVSAIKNVAVIEVDHFTTGDSPREIATTAGRAIVEFSNALAANPLDLVFVLGDRTEMLAACLAALIHKIPIAHLHGGDLTEGAYDEQCRHAITKLAHIHFSALSEHAARIEQRGEERWRIHNVGALALDALKDFAPETVAELQSALGIDFLQPTIVLL
jgi:UDP-hydrolysing UDP-N-acetyl-D-glucosamine 2-epimerase